MSTFYYLFVVITCFPWSCIYLCAVYNVWVCIFFFGPLFIIILVIMHYLLSYITSALFMYFDLLSSMVSLSKECYHGFYVGQ